MNTPLTVHQKQYLREVRAAQARSLEAYFDRWILATGIRAIEPQYKFHPTRKWRVDFAIPHLKVAVEIQGGRFRRGNGAHSSPAGIERDVHKSNALQEHGWLCAYMTAEMVKDGSGFEVFKKFLCLRDRKFCAL